MATFYLDFENGNDANTGADWANAWKTINSGATAARTAPGDIIRVAKTADPTSIGDATWTSKSATVTLATAQTTNLYLDGSWTAANSATVTTTTTRKQGSNAAQITTPASTATATKYAYYATGTLDLSSYDAITFWFRNNTSAVADANRYVLKLCSDATGDTAVDEFAIPAIPSTTRWVPFTLTRTGGGALGSSIQSIALYTGSSSPGNSQQIWIDNVLACDESGLNLTALISKNSAAYDGADTWHGLQSLDGTTVTLGMRNEDGVGSSNRGYYTTGTSPDTVTTYVRPTYKFAIQSSTTGAAQPIQESGSAGSLITYSGGWNTSSNTQDGETWIDGQNGVGYGLSFGSIQYIKIERFGVTRFGTGVHCSSTNRDCVINTIITNSTQGLTMFTDSTLNTTINNCSNGCVIGSSLGQNVININILNTSGATNLSSVSGSNLTWQNNSNQLTVGASYFVELDKLDYSANSSSLSFSGFIFIKELIVNNNTSSTLFSATAARSIIVNKLTASGNTNLGEIIYTLIVKQTNALSTQLIGSGAVSYTKIWNSPVLMYNSVNNDSNDNRSFWRYGNALSQTTTRHTATGIAWQINITNSSQTLSRPIYFPIAKVAVNSGSLVTVKAWVKLSHATDIGAKLLIQANEIAGISADVTATKTADTNWEELTVTFTPTAAGVAQIYVQGYWLANTADESIYVDDITVSQ
jgi:hypothetical protein